MANTFLETAFSYFRSEAIIHKNMSVEGSSAETVARIGNCQITHLKIQWSFY